MDLNRLFNAFANRTARACGHPLTFVACLAIVLVWAATGPSFHYSETWQLVINTGTTIITFLMVFLIQNTQNRDNAAVQAKLDEIILTSKADNHFIGIERLTDHELDELQKTCQAAAEKSQALSERAAKVVHARRQHQSAQARGQAKAKAPPKTAPRRKTSA